MLVPMPVPPFLVSSPSLTIDLRTHRPVPGPSKRKAPFGDCGRPMAVNPTYPIQLCFATVPHTNFATTPVPPTAVPPPYTRDAVLGCSHCVILLLLSSVSCSASYSRSRSPSPDTWEQSCVRVLDEECRQRCPGLPHSTAATGNTSHPPNKLQSTRDVSCCTATLPHQSAQEAALRLSAG